MDDIQGLFSWLRQLDPNAVLKDGKVPEIHLNIGQKARIRFLPDTTEVIGYVQGEDFLLETFRFNKRRFYISDLISFISSHHIH